MEYWTAFVLGLLGSLHCAGMCGPLAMALPGAGGGAIAFTSGRAAYNLGRVLTYCLLGVFFGVLGKTFLMTGVQRWVSITLGVMLLAGLAGSRQLALTRPVTALVTWMKSRMSTMLRRRSFLALTLLGLLNGLLPCGLVYVAGAAATTTGDILSGAGYMAAFGAGTVPMMLAISLSGRLVPITLRLKLARAIPVSVLVIAVLLIFRGLSLGIPFLSPDLSQGSCCHP
jgi:sulfite exporter TauE/SafE